MTNYMIGKYEIQRDVERRQNRRNSKLERIVKRILLAELALIGFEGMYHFGSVIRGYNSFGGESFLAMVLIGCVALWIRRSK